MFAIACGFTDVYTVPYLSYYYYYYYHHLFLSLDRYIHEKEKKITKNIKVIIVNLIFPYWKLLIFDTSF